MKNAFLVFFLSLVLVSLVSFLFFSSGSKQNSDSKESSNQNENEKINDERFSEVRIIQLSTYGESQSKPAALVQYKGYIRTFNLNDVPVADGLTINSTIQGFICLKIDGKTDKAVELKKCK